VVISHKIDEKTMGYSGSKLIFNNIVKEQRVDGSWSIIKPMFLRCTLMGFERNYQINNLSKQLTNFKYSTLNININININKKFFCFVLF
jgi:hypothetical protein